MKATLSKDFQYPDRYARVVIEDCGNPGEDFSVLIQRTSDFMYLAPNGRWVVAKERIEAQKPNWENSTLTFLLPLQMLRDLDTLDTHFLYVGDDEARCPVLIPEELNVGSAAFTGGVPDMPEPSLGPSASPFGEESAASASTSDHVEAPLDTPPLWLDPEPSPAEAPAPKEETAPKKEPGPLDKAAGGKPPLLVIIAGVAVLVAIGAAVFYLMRSPSDDKTAPVAERPAVEQPASRSAAPAGGIAGAKQLLRDGAGPEQLVKTANALLGSGSTSNDQDAAFLLYEDAAGKGDAKAMYMVARFYDPSVAMGRGTIQPDPNMALDMYRKAEAAGHADARADIAELKEWAKRQADAGSATAQDLLERF